VFFFFCFCFFFVFVSYLDDFRGYFCLYGILIFCFRTPGLFCFFFFFFFFLCNDIYVECFLLVLLFVFFLVLLVFCYRGLDGISLMFVFLR